MPESKAMDDITYEKAVTFNLAKLKRFREIYQREINAEEMIARLLMNQSKLQQEEADKNAGGGPGLPDFESNLLKRLRELGGGAARVTGRDLAKTLRADSLAHSAESTRLAKTLSNINAAIIHLEEKPGR